MLTYADVCVSQHTSAYVSIRRVRQSAYVCVSQHTLTCASVSIRQHTSAYVSLTFGAAQAYAVLNAGGAVEKMREQVNS